MHELAIKPATGERFIDSYALIPKHLFLPGSVRGSASSPSMTLSTSMFMQTGNLHIAGNMLYLWIFENSVEDSMERLGLL
jgi:membrane associated rhomboid family serine protease